MRQIIAVATAAVAAAATALLVHAEPRLMVALVVGFGVGTIAHQIGKGVRARRAPARPHLTVRDTKLAYDGLRNVVASAGANPNVETALLLLEAEKQSFDRTYTGSDNLEAKATTLLGIVAGASSAFGLFGVAKAGSTIPMTPALFMAFAFVLISFAALLYMLRAKTFVTPDMRVYVTPAVAQEDNRVGVALTLASRYNEAREGLRREVAAEPQALFVAYASIAVAALLAVLNAAAPTSTSAHTSAVTSPANASPIPAAFGATPGAHPTSLDHGRNFRRPSPDPGAGRP